MSDTDKTIKIPLKTEMKTFDNKVIPDPSLLDPEKRKTAKTQEELDEMSPPLTIGALMGTMFSTSIAPKDGAHAAKLQRVARKVSLKLQTAKGEWAVDTKELEAIIEDVKQVKSGLSAPKYAGEVIIMLEDLLFEEKRKEHQEATKRD